MNGWNFIGIAMILVPLYLIINNTPKTADHDHLAGDLFTVITVMIVISSYFGLAGWLIGR